MGKTGCIVALAIGLVAGTGGIAGADPIDGKAARDAVFSHRGGQVVVLEQDVLSAENAAQLAATGGVIQYYGAIAVAPDEGFISQANQAAANHHSIEAAEEAALTACNAARSGGRRCVIIAHYLPDDWEEGRPVQLSQTATDALRRTYRRARKPRALAISPMTGAFAVDRGDGAQENAIATCNEEASQLGATDCNVVVSD